MSHDLLHEQHAPVNSALEHYRAFAIAVRREWQAADRRCDGWIKAGCGWTTGGFEKNSMHERDLLREMLEKGSEDTIKPLAALMSEGLGNDLLKFWRNLTIKIEPNHPRANPRAYWRAKWEDEMEKLDTRMQVSLRRVAPTAPNPPTLSGERSSPAPEADKAAPTYRNDDDMLCGDTFKGKWGLQSGTMRKAQRDGRLRGEKRNGRWYFSKSSAEKLWPDAFANY